MGALADCVSLPNNRQRIAALHRLQRDLGKAGIPERLDDKDEAAVSARIREIRDYELWHALWSILIKCQRSPRIVDASREILGSLGHSPQGSQSRPRLDHPLRYLFMNSPGERETLLGAFLKCGDLYLELAAAEELMGTDPRRAFESMFDIYEAAFHKIDHDVVDSIELWITSDTDTIIEQLLQSRASAAVDEALRDRYSWLLSARAGGENHEGHPHL